MAQVRDEYDLTKMLNTYIYIDFFPDPNKADNLKIRLQLIVKTTKAEEKFIAQGAKKRYNQILSVMLGEFNMLKDDYLNRMVENTARMLAKLILGRDTVIYELPDEEAYTEADDLFVRLELLLKAGKINEAENLLFEETDVTNSRYYELATVFYLKLNQYDDDYLEGHDYSREEIEDGINRMAGKFGVSL